MRCESFSSPKVQWIGAISPWHQCCSSPNSKVFTLLLPINLVDLFSASNVVCYTEEGLLATHHLYNSVQLFQCISFPWRGSLSGTCLPGFPFQERMNTILTKMHSVSQDIMWINCQTFSFGPDSE